MSIERFFIIANRDKDRNQEFSYRIRAFLEAYGKTCNIVYSEDDRKQMRGQLHSSRDCILVLGGDGTVLEAARLASGTGTGILGINIGNLGYLAEVEGYNWESALLRILSGGYEIESRMMLDGVVTDRHGNEDPSTRGQALNDIVITRSRGLKILDFNVYVDGRFLNRYSADGVIVSTATGSTGYNMSAGGPIVEPKARVILLTPISPHTLSSRSIVLSEEDRITIEMAPPRKRKTLTAECDYDGGRHIPLHSGDIVSINASSGTTSMIRLNHRSFLDTLHRKLTS